MKFKLGLLAIAAAFSVGNAHADFNFVNTGNGTLLFIAHDVDANVQFTADLGLTVSSFTNDTTFTSGLAAPVTWNFATNSTNWDIAGTNAWSDAYTTFLNTQTGGNFKWAVIAGDNVSAGSVPNRNLLATGNATQAQMLALATTLPISNGAGAFSNFDANVNNLGNLNAPNTNGAAISTSANGNGYLPNNGAMGPNFNGALTWSYLMDNGVASTFQRAQQNAGAVVTQFGNPNAPDALSANPITFTFDIATNSLVLAPIPEPSTYAMLLAGLAAVGLMARRRKV